MILPITVLFLFYFTKTNAANEQKKVYLSNAKCKIWFFKKKKYFYFILIDGTIKTHSKIDDNLLSTYGIWVYHTGHQ